MQQCGDYSWDMVLLFMSASKGESCRNEANPLYIVGDIHGHFDKLVNLLRRTSLIDAEHAWCGETATLWFLGDFFDRGPDGIACIDLVMRLQGEAKEAGGTVGALLGNHEPLLLAAQRFSKHAVEQVSTLFVMNWIHNGGVLADIEQLTPAHVAWLSELPAMTHVGNRLLVHADSWIYSEYGDSVDEVNRNIASVLQGNEPGAWDRLLHQFTRRFAFAEKMPRRFADAIPMRDQPGATRAQAFLDKFGGEQLVHGHTPIHYITRQPCAQIDEPLVYAGGLCVNVDGGIYLGGAGFVYTPPASW